MLKCRTCGRVGQITETIDEEGAIEMCKCGSIDLVELPEDEDEEVSNGDED
jgi:hypothetical protein